MTGKTSQESNSKNLIEETSTFSGNLNREKCVDCRENSNEGAVQVTSGETVSIHWFMLLTGNRQGSVNNKFILCPNGYVL